MDLFKLPNYSIVLYNFLNTFVGPRLSAYNSVNPNVRGNTLEYTFAHDLIVRTTQLSFYFFKFQKFDSGTTGRFFFLICSCLMFRNVPLGVSSLPLAMIWTNFDIVIITMEKQMTSSTTRRSCVPSNTMKLPWNISFYFQLITHTPICGSTLMDFR